MSIRIADTISIVKEVLESNHPDSTVDTKGDVDFLVGSVGAEITVGTSDDVEVTEEDIENIKERVDEEIDGRRVTHELRTKIGEPTHRFSLTS